VAVDKNSEYSERDKIRENEDWKIGVFVLFFCY
jgi:hypothetical protein